MKDNNKAALEKSRDVYNALLSKSSNSRIVLRQQTSGLDRPADE